MWSSRATVLVLCCVGYSIARVLQIGRPYFESRNFRNILHWNQRNSTDEPILYSVQYIIYGTEWKEKWECQNITALSCDLTAETADIMELYHGRVSANGAKPVQSTRFYPIQHTILGSPEVFVFPGMISVTLTLKLPVGPDSRTSLEELLREHTVVIISYTVTLTPAEQMPCHKFLDPQQLPHTNTSDGREVTVQGLKPNTEYCGIATYTVECNNKKLSSEPAIFNLKTHTGPRPLKPLFTASAVVGVLLIMVLLATTVWLYVSRKSRVPYSLTLTRSKVQLPYQHFSKENIYISRLEISVDPHGLQAKGLGRQGGCHPPQDCNNVPPPCNSYANQQAQLQSNTDNAHSSTHYSLVVGVQYANDNVEWFQQLTPDAEVGSNHLQPTTMPASQAHFDPVGDAGLTRQPMLEPEPGPLVLVTQKGPDGLLQLPELFTQMMPEVLLGDLGSASCPDREGVPLLSSLITQEEEEERQDSMLSEDHVERTYLSSQVNPTFCRSPLSPPSNPQQIPDTMSNSPASILPQTTVNCPSSYKQNWIVGACPLAATSGETPNWGVVDPQPWPEEGGAGTFLERWEVKIQG